MRLMSGSRLIGMAVFVGCLMGAGQALAMEAAARSAVDLHAGPDAGTEVVDQLTESERVNVTQCAPSGFCFVEHTGPDGWVAAADLRPTNTDGLDQGIVQQGSGDYPDCSFGFVVGEGAPTLSVNCDTRSAAPPPASAPATPQDKAAAPDVPAVFSSGQIELKQGLTADLDSGELGGGGADIWYQSSGAEGFIQPQRGARLALGDGTDRGFKGCWAADFAMGGVALADVPAGTHVCVKTGDGRISQFEVSGLEGTALQLSYTTWGN